MTRTKHIFRQDVPCLRYAALGDTAVRALAIYHLIERYRLEALIVPQPNPALVPLWQAVFGRERILADASQIPREFRDARMSAPTSLDWCCGSAGFNVFESVMWENGFFDTAKARISPPLVFPCDVQARAAMIYPAEETDGNRVYDSAWWRTACETLRDKGYRLHLLGHKSHPRLAELFAHTEFDRSFEPTVEGLRTCVAASSLAVGGSTGPTWTLLFSDIPQIVLESRRSPHGYWFFERCQPVLTKRLQIVPALETAIPAPLEQ